MLHSNIEKYEIAAANPTALRRILARIHYVDDCWIWLGALSDRGYAIATISKQAIFVHRLTYRIVRGELIDGLVLDHICRNPACVNPMHTEQVTSAENTHRGQGNGHQLTCPAGHEYSGDNLYVSTDGAGYERRYCRQCTRDRNKARSLARAQLSR